MELTQLPTAGPIDAERREEGDRVLVLDLSLSTGLNQSASKAPSLEVKMVKDKGTVIRLVYLVFPTLAMSARISHQIANLMNWST